MTANDSLVNKMLATQLTAKTISTRPLNKHLRFILAVNPAASTSGFRSNHANPNN